MAMCVLVVVIQTFAWHPVSAVTQWEVLAVAWWVLGSVDKVLMRCVNR